MTTDHETTDADVLASALIEAAEMIAHALGELAEAVRESREVSP